MVGKIVKNGSGYEFVQLTGEENEDVLRTTATLNADIYGSCLVDARRLLKDTSLDTSAVIAVATALFAKLGYSSYGALQDRLNLKVHELKSGQV